MRRLSAFLADRRGLSAIEFSLIAPVLTAVLILGWDGWLMINQSVDMRTAVQTGARYYQIGGSSDTAAQTAALAAWVHKPAGGSLSVARACYCGSTVTACSQSCVGSTPSTYITLTATSPFNGTLQSRTLTEQEVVRVR
ncbi:MAG: TadE/TadG family type IV pilus assembly protein [Rhodospirillaceae bacterium]